MSVTSETVRGRLYFWNKNPPRGGYSQTAYSPGPDGHRYRDDCSGYVSMLLGLTGSPNTGMMVGSAFTTPIRTADLRFGDAIIAVAGGGHASGHVVLFDRWRGDGHTAYIGHQFGYGAAPLHGAVTYPYAPDGRTFRPYRFHALAAPSITKAGLTAGRAQILLNRTPGRPGLVTDGVYGAKTIAAVEDFQRAHGLPATGELGDATWDVLKTWSTYYGWEPPTARERALARLHELQESADVSAAAIGHLETAYQNIAKADADPELKRALVRYRELLDGVDLSPEAFQHLRTAVRNVIAVVAA